MKIGQLAVNKNLKLRVVCGFSEDSFCKHNPFYDNGPVRGERTGCLWAPHWGTRRLLYDCVWLVSESQSRPQILLRVRLAPLAVSLHLRSRLENCVFIEGALSEPRLSWLQVTKAQVRRRPTHASVVSCLCDLSYLGKPNYLAAAPRPWEDSNLVDPASSHMLVSKIKPCMSKYKWYTMKLRMAH